MSSLHVVRWCHICHASLAGARALLRVHRLGICGSVRDVVIPAVLVPHGHFHMFRFSPFFSFFAPMGTVRGNRETAKDPNEKTGPKPAACLVSCFRNRNCGRHKKRSTQIMSLKINHQHSIIDRLLKPKPAVRDESHLPRKTKTTHPAATFARGLRHVIVVRGVRDLGSIAL